jgi:hypothetical protein
MVNSGIKNDLKVYGKSNQFNFYICEISFEKCNIMNAFSSLKFPSCFHDSTAIRLKHETINVGDFLLYFEVD